MKTVHVAAGIIRNPQDNSVLAVQRGYGDMQGLWEFPGGKVQRGETAYDACIRELQEELCVEVHNLRAFYTVEYDYEAFHLSMECFFAISRAGRFLPPISKRPSAGCRSARSQTSRGCPPMSNSFAHSSPPQRQPISPAKFPMRTWSPLPPSGHHPPKNARRKAW